LGRRGDFEYFCPVAIGLQAAFGFDGSAIHSFTVSTVTSLPLNLESAVENEQGGFFTTDFTD
jgi:hypothetical protein